MTTTEFPTTEFPTTPYSPKPPAFNLIDCKNSFDSVAQKIYICAGHPELFPILKYAEEVAKKACELDFQHELWNCSGFSLLRQPNISKAGIVHWEDVYLCIWEVYSMLLESFYREAQPELASWAAQVSSPAKTSCRGFTSAEQLASCSKAGLEPGGVHGNTWISSCLVQVLGMSSDIVCLCNINTGQFSPARFE